MTLESVSGIFIKVLPYSDSAQIGSLFTEERGLLHLFIQSFRIKSGGGQAILAPLNEVETILYRGQKDLWNCRECYLKNCFMGLRNSWKTLQGALELIDILSMCHLEERPTPLLYLLFRNYLSRLEQEKNVWKILGSFYLKILRHEGLWSDDPSSYPGIFEKEEWQICQILTYCRNTGDFAVLPNDPPQQLMEKIRQLFIDRMH